MNTLVHAKDFYSNYELVFIKETSKKMFKPVMKVDNTCSDYLVDIINNRPGIKTYTLWDGTLQEDATLFAFSASPERIQFIKDNIHKVHEIEAANHYRRTELLDVEGYKNIIIVRGSNLWRADSFRISLYLKLIRNMAKYSGNISFENREGITIQQGKFLAWIALNGHLAKVNSGCKNTAGLVNMNLLGHGMHGIQSTLLTYDLLKAGPQHQNHKSLSTRAYYMDVWKERTDNFARFNNVDYLYNKYTKEMKV